MDFNARIDTTVDTLQPLYNMFRYNMVLDITRFKDGSQKCMDYSGGTSVGNHNRSSVGIGCCCRCDFPIIIGS